MRSNSLEKNLEQKLKLAIQDVTPGVQVRAYHLGRLVCDIAVGQTNSIYDLASLTKVFFTQQSMMRCFDQGLWKLDTKVVDILPDFFSPSMTVLSLLNHTSGLDWWIPFYKQVNESGNWLEKRPQIYKILNQSENLKPQGKAVYSDLGFILLGFILEKLENKNLHEVWKQTHELFYPFTETHFNLNNELRHPADQYAPTEECVIRKQVLRGIVHDENTWSFGGISSHAGLFGSIDDLGQMGMTIRSQLLGIAKYNIRQKTAQLFAQRSIPPEVGDWAIGYMMPSVENASCGHHFSTLSIGHTGFTGTSFWYDPRNDLMVLALSNRVNYGRENKKYIQLRPQIHNWIFESIKRTV